jgi:hypothetical protein
MFKIKVTRISTGQEKIIDEISIQDISNLVNKCDGLLVEFVL